MKGLDVLTKKALIVLALFLSVIALILVIIVRPYPAETSYLDKVYSNEKIIVNELGNRFEILLENASTNEAIIFYPGGLVSPDAYLYMLSEIAIETNQSIYVSKFPLNLGVLDIYNADTIQKDYPEIESWTIMGHSLGGAMACRYAKENSSNIDKLVLMASYCDQSISDKQVSVLMLYGSKNNGINTDVLEEFKLNLPSESKSVLIEGMNHAQFGNYGAQQGDNIATIEDDLATSIVVDEVVRFID